jgi:hypothetical protein
LQRSGRAARASGRLTPTAYPNSKGSCLKFFSAMKFSAKVHPLK